jgi:hypothetical protein
MYTATKIPFIYSFSGNSAASAPISTFLCLWAIYIVPGSVHIFPPAEQGDRSWEYINRSQTHECGNWDWYPDIPFLGIFVSKFLYFVFAVYNTCESHVGSVSCNGCSRATVSRSRKHSSVFCRDSAAFSAHPVLMNMYTSRKNINIFCIHKGQSPLSPWQGGYTVDDYGIGLSYRAAMQPM